MKGLLIAASGMCVAVSALAMVPKADEAASAAGVPAPAAQPKDVREAQPRSKFEQPVPDIAREPTLFVVGYAHLDTQWRWTYVQTIKEYIPNTLNGNFKLFEKYPHYVFNFSGSRRYAMMEEYYPEDFAKLKEWVAQGRWFPCGSSVDENDSNVPSGESLVRQVLYGNKYFRAKFGVASEEYMLPDCFGFPAALPQVLAHCGIKGFSTQKLTWNAAVPIPFKVGVWEGPDGSSIMAALDPGAYVGEVREDLATSNAWETRINNNGKLSGVFTDYHYYGTGDQGGAPSERSVAMVEQSTQTAGTVKVISGAADLMFKAITPEMREHLPRYKGELMLTQHSAGSITSEAYMKRWNRKNELLADAAERASVAAWWMGGRAYPAQRLEDAWYLVLGSQMHDILPGTSLPKAYEFSWNDEVIAANQFAGVMGDAGAAVIGGMDTRGAGTPVVVYNATSIEREDVVEAEVPGNASVRRVRVTGPDGKQVAAQVLGPGEWGVRVAFLARVPSVGFAAYSVELGDAAPAATALKVQEKQLENEAYVVKLNDDGDVASIFDKKAKRELLSGPARLGLHYENPAQWPAWNQDWEDRQLPPKAMVGGPAKFKVVEQGPARVAVEVTREAEGSTFVQKISLASGGARVEFDLTVDWRTRERSLRAAFPLAVSNPNATYDIQAGVIERPNSHAKEFEYCFHQWMDLTDVKADYGVSVLCDSKFGSDKPDDHTMRITLLHTPGTRGGYPDQGSQDLGKHNVKYAVVGHAGTWAEGTPAQAVRLNQPLVAFRAPAHEGALGKTFSLMRVSDPGVQITALKKAEASDEVIVRLRDVTGRGVKGLHVVGAKGITAAREVDGQEREIAPPAKATVQNGELVTDMRGLSLRAFALKLGPAPTTLTKVQSAPIALTFDTDVVSTNAKRADGDFDGGLTIPGEQMPGTLDVGGVGFTLGSAAVGAKNAMVCRGQELAIPPSPTGGFDRLYLLAAATKDVQASAVVGGKQVPLNVQGWTGYVGQWDNRVWRSDLSPFAGPSASDLRGLDPGFIKDDRIAWYCSHVHAPDGDIAYQYCYIYCYALDLPEGTRSVKLPDEVHIKVFAATAAKVGTARAVAAAPVFDTLRDHVQDGPSIVPASGTFADATEVRVEPGLYWRAGAVHYTIDGSEPTAQSPVYDGKVLLSKPATLKAAVLGRDGKMGPAALAKLEVNDKTAPSARRVSALFGAPTVWVEFSEPLAKSAVDKAHYTINPKLAVESAALSEDGRSVALKLGALPESGKKYELEIRGVSDASPGANTLQKATLAFEVRKPVFALEEVKPEQMGTDIKDVPGLPVKGKDAWTLNMFVRMAKQPPNRTLIAGFGKCEESADGGARYMSKFPSGIQFWSHNRDVPGRAPFDLGKWQMITAAYDGKVLRLYKDGAKIGEREIELADDESMVSLAPMDPWEHRRRFEGEIRHLAIWDVALGDESVAALRRSVTLP